MKPSLKNKLFDFLSDFAPMKLQRRRSRQAFLIMMMILSVTQIASAQKCSPIHSCPAGYTCVNFHCEMVVSPAPPSLSLASPPSPSPSPEFCRCGLRNYGCKTRECIARCAPQCSFVSDENNGTSSIIISSNTAPLSIIIHFQVEDAGTISIKIYDVAGRLIKTLAADKMDQGSHEVEWNEQDEEGNLVDAGIYILQLDTPNKSETKKIAMIN